MLVTRFLGRHPASAFDDALRTLAGLNWTGNPSRPGVIAYFPSYRGNPYQELLYSELHSAGLHAAPVYDTKTALRFVNAVSGADVEVVVHAHWLNFVTARAEDEAAARANVKEFVDDLQRIKDSGAPLLWTVHNILPHEDRYPDVDVELRRCMVDLVDRIHVMSPHTPDLVSSWFKLPEDRTFVVPHPSYHGVYPSWMPRALARQKLGIPSGAIVFLLIGSIKPYKGLTELLDAFNKLSQMDPGRFILLVAGNPSDDEETTEFRRRVLMHPTILATFGKIPHEAMQIYLRAADVGVFPYRRSLNSGALALTTTFGLPAVLPTHSGEAAGVDNSYAEVYDSNDPEGLVRALTIAAQRLLTDEAKRSAMAASERISLPVVARTFAGVIRSWMDEYRDGEATSA